MLLTLKLFDWRISTQLRTVARSKAAPDRFSSKLVIWGMVGVIALAFVSYNSGANVLVPLAAILSILGFSIYGFERIIRHAAAFPEISMLDGAEILMYRRMTMETKQLGQIPSDPSTVTTDPSLTYSAPSRDIIDAPDEEQAELPPPPPVANLLPSPRMPSATAMPSAEAEGGEQKQEGGKS